MKVTDTPIWRSEDDLLGRDSLAALIAEEITHLDHSSGGVLAITGRWGVGKTSLIKLVQAHLDQVKRVRTVWFNPWLFSGTNELVERFFQELSAQLGKGDKKLKKVASGMSSYGKALMPLHRLPVLGGSVEAVSGSLAFVDEVIKIREGSIAERQEALRDQMNNLDTTILVVIDDIDRLEPSEVREIFKLVRLTGDFPNLIYLLSFDRQRVEEAFSQNGPSGRHYIEKIVYIVHDVPEVPKAVLRERMIEGLMVLLDDKKLVVPLDSERLSAAYSRIIEPNIKTIRDVKRFLASIGITLASLVSEIDPVDLISIEAIRIFMPQLLRDLSQRSAAIASTENDINIFDTTRIKRLKNAVTEIVEREKDEQEVARGVLEILFPLAWRAYEKEEKGYSEIGDYLAGRRVAHRDVFDLYLNRFEGPYLLAMRKAEGAYAVAADRGKLETYFAGIESSQLEAVVSAFEELAETLPEEAAVPISVVLLNSLKRIPDRQRKFHDLGPTRTIRRIVFLALVNSNADHHEAIIDAIYPDLSRFEERRTLLEVSDGQTMSGDRLVKEDFVTKLKHRLAEDFRRAAPTRLSEEPHLLWLAKWINDGIDGASPFPELLDNPENAAALLKNSVVEQLRMVPDSDPRIMDVDTVVEVLGDRAALDRMMEMCQGIAKHDPSIADLLPIASQSIHAYDRRCGKSEGIAADHITPVAAEVSKQE